MKDQLVFNTLNASTIADSDSVGAFVRANDGALITKHSIAESIKASLVTQGLIFKSKLAGAIGNTYSFTVVDTGGAGPLTYTEVAGDIVLDLVGLTPTAAQVITFLMTTTPNSYVDITAGIPAGNIVVAAQADLAGGEDTNLHKHLDVYAAMADGEGNAITSTNGALNVNVAGGVNVEVDLSHLDDSVRLGNGTDFFTSTSENSDIALDVHISNSTLAVTQSGTWTVGLSEDHNYGAVGATTLRTASQIGNASGAADFDSGASGAQTLRVTIATDDVIATSDAALANTAIISTAKILAVAGTAETVVSSAQAARKYLSIYNLDNNKIYIGGSGVTIANGFPLSPGSYMELRAGVSSAVYFVGSTAKTPEIRTLELS